MTLTQEEAHRLFEYKDGVLYWRNRPKQSRRPQGDMEAGCPSHGYKRVTVNKQKYYVHQLVFLMHYGYIPKLIDHIDQDSNNNKIHNLREANKAINSLNRQIQPNNKSGYKGVFWNNQRKKWQAKLYIRGKSIHCGFFKNVELAGEFMNLVREMVYGSSGNIVSKGV